MESYTWICLMLFYICMTKTSQGHMTLDNAKDDTNSEDSSMNTMLFKFLLETLVSDSSDLSHKLDRLEDKDNEQTHKIEDLEAILSEQTDEILELKENLVSSEKLVIEQNQKISELETNSDKIDKLETTLGEQNDEILELKGNFVSSEKHIIEQNKKISMLETNSDKIEEIETTLGKQNDDILELKGNLISSEKLLIEQNKKISELETKQNARQQQPSYAFSVYDLSRARPSRVGDILVFTKTHLNEDGLYSTTTGKYTTSVNGIYVFHATLTSDISNKNIHVEFKAGGNAIGRFAVVDTASDITSSGSATARLQKGTEVYLRVTYVSSGYRFREDGHYMNSFSGYLISK